MKSLGRALHKIFTVISGLTLVFNSILPASLVPIVFAPPAYAQETTPTDTPTPTETIAPTPTDTVSPTQEVTPEVTPEPTVVPTVTEEATPSPTPEELSPTPTEVAQPTETGPPAEGQILDGASTETPAPSVTETATPTPTVTPEEPEQGQLAAAVLQNVEAESLNLDNVDPTNSATITTDKADYAPTDTAVITGSEFKPNHKYDLTVKSDDPPATSTTVEITTDNQGTFVYAYQLDGTYRQNYQVVVTNKGGKVIATTTFTDGPPSVDLDQCRNGAIGSPVTCTGSAWVNGNAGAENSHYFEGDSIVYRARFDNLALGAHSLTIEWDTTQTGKHAIDYLTTFSRTETTADPCSGVNGCGSPTTFAIAADPNVTGAGVSPIAGNFTLYNGTITSLSAYTLTGVYSGNSSTKITINFTASAANPVLAWGGHIATRVDWGADNSAVNISGSPYHTRLDSFSDGNVGQQDRSLSAGAVIFPASITIIKQATPEGSTSFPFVASPSPLTNFSLVDDGTIANTKVFSGITTFTDKNGSPLYTVTENTPAGWSLTNLSCVVTSANSGSQTINSATVSINLQEGENVTCTYTNTRSKVTPTVATQIHNADHNVVTTVPAGTTVHDSATVTGNLGTVTGNVTFDWFTNGTCDGSPADTSGSFALSGGSVDATTFTKGPLSAGSYAFKAHYTDDSNYLSADGPCEPLTVSKINTTVATQAHNPSHSDITNGSVALGTAVHDNSTVTPTTTGPTMGGTITYNLYSNAVCDSALVIPAETVSVRTESTPQTLGAGNYGYKAVYSGDTNYNGSTGSCEPFTVNQAQLTVTTNVHDTQDNPITTANLGDIVHDQATLSGTINGFSAPAITFTFYNNGTCMDGSSVSNIGDDPAGGVRSANSSALTTGSYSYKGSVVGNANYLGHNSDCEPFTVGQGTSTVSTTLHKADESTVAVGESVPLGTIMHDLATVNVSGSFVPTGNVSFKAYLNGICTGDGIAMGSVALDGANPGVAHPSTSTGALVAGDYSFNATWAGDTNYTGNTSSCENFSVSKADTRTSTEVHNVNNDDITGTTVALGTDVHDSATVSGQVGQQALGGTVTYDFFNNRTCDGTPAGSETVSVGTESSVKGSLGAGDYSYLVTYSGDANYNGSTALCEPFTIDKARLGISTLIHDANHGDVTSVDLGSIVHDTATVTGAVDGYAAPDVTFKFFPNNTCTGNGTSAANTGTDGTAVRSADTNALGAGDYSYEASVAGNANYIGATATCEPFTVDQETPDITTTIHDAGHNAVGPELLVDTAHDSASVSGIQGFDPTGDVDFRFFEDSACEGEYADAGTVDLDGNGIAHPSDSQGPLDSGFYAFQAHYNGDGNYSSADSACEPFNITKLVVHKQVDDGSNEYLGGDSEANDLGFRWKLDGGSDRLMGSDVITTPSVKHDINENSISGYAFTGWYEDFDEGNDFSCQSPESTTIPVSLTVAEGETRSIVLCNQLQDPVLTITKENNTGGASRSPGESVLFTITVTATQSAAFNVQVTDLPAGGFVPRDGTYTASSSVRGDILSLTGNPGYHSPGVWNLGDMIVNEKVTLTYLADIASDQQPGTYYDLAWAVGCKTDESCGDVYANAVTPGFVEEHYAGTDVRILTDKHDGADVKVVGEVLGASTELPATGANTFWIYVAFALITGGITLGALGWFLRRKYA